MLLTHAMRLLHRRIDGASQTRQRTPTHSAPFSSLCEQHACPLLLSTLCLYCTGALAEPAKPASACPLTARRLARSANSTHVHCCLARYASTAPAHWQSQPNPPAHAHSQRAVWLALRVVRMSTPAYARYASTAPAHWRSQPNPPAHAHLQRAV